MISRTSSLKLQQHWYVLLAPLTCDALVAGVMLGAAVQFGSLWFALPAVLLLVHTLLAVYKWHTFSITFTSRWIAVSHTRFGLPHTTIYPYAAIRSVSHVQGPLGLLTNSGSLALALETKTHHFHGLTPHEQLAGLLT